MLKIVMLVRKDQRRLVWPRYCGSCLKFVGRALSWLVEYSWCQHLLYVWSSNIMLVGCMSLPYLLATCGFPKLIKSQSKDGRNRLSCDLWPTKLGSLVCKTRKSEQQVNNKQYLNSNLMLIVQYALYYVLLLFILFYFIFFSFLY